jgi:glycosyltransferase involved in cell wall biosynthesis
MIVGQLLEGDGPGGAERLVLQFALELRRRGHDVFTVIPSGGAAWLGHEMGRLGFRWATVDRRPMFDPRVVRDLARLFGDAGVGAIHSHEYIGVFGAAAAKRMGVPHVVTLHGSPYFAAKWRRRAAFRWAARHSVRVVGVARDTSTHAEQVLGLAPGSVLTVPNGIAPTPGDRSLLRDALGIGADEIVVGAVGNVSPRKNHIQLLEALAEVHARRPDVRWRMVVAGSDAGSLSAIESLAVARGLADRVHMLGHRQDPENLLAAADVFAMPSLHEGMPLAIIEAMFAGLPVVASTAGGVADMLDDGVEGHLFGVGDTPALIRALERVLTDPQRRAAMGEAGRQRAARQFGIGPMMDGYLRLYGASDVSR